MAKIGSAITAKVVERLTGTAGVNSGLAALTQEEQELARPLDADQVCRLHTSADLVERSTAVRYPTVNVYCEKIDNRLTEKFRTFSGTAQVAIELRHSQDRLDGLQDALELYTDAATRVLDSSRGDWGDGMFYSGGYEVAFAAAKHGGRNFLQVAKITLEIGVSIS